MSKFRSLIGVIGIAATLGAVPIATNAQAATCATTMVNGSTWDEGLGSCSSFAGASEQARITLDCTLWADRNTSWFHDYSVHYTGGCPAARRTFLSSRWV